jgi:hypothetical protein
MFAVLLGREAHGPVNRAAPKRTPAHACIDSAAPE